jgi:hypothetical protein
MRCLWVIATAAIAKRRVAVRMTLVSDCRQRPLKITGKVKYHDIKAESGNTLTRGFCPECGARLFGKTSGMPDLVMITAGSLDDPSQYMPSMDIFTASAQPWDHMNPALPKFPKMPPMEG